VTVIEVKIAAVTVKLVEPLTEPDVTVIVVEPTATPVASPLLAMVAAASFEEPQVTKLVRFCVLPSV
jgi:hypothetical protein